MSDGSGVRFTASRAPAAQSALARLTERYGQADPGKVTRIVALGGDGFMLQTLHSTERAPVPVYGMNCGTIGFLMNEYDEDRLIERLDAAEEAVIHPLMMKAEKRDGSLREALAYNEVSLLRAGPQAARLRITIDGKVRMPELVCDGALVATPAGSTAYNYSAHGPILPISADVLALTAIAPYRPRRWRGALVPDTATVVIEVLEASKRPVMADADSRSIKDVLRVEIATARDFPQRLLFDPGHGLEERLISEQFI